RRHTRFSRDWSSDVCSSDLAQLPSLIKGVPLVNQAPYYSLKDYEHLLYQKNIKRKQQIEESEELEKTDQYQEQFKQLLFNTPNKIGRASCRERVQIAVEERA